MALLRSALLLAAACASTTWAWSDEEKAYRRHLQDLTRSSKPLFADPVFDCAWRPLAYKYAQMLQPFRSAQSFQQLHDALELSTACNVTFDAAGLRVSEQQPRPRAAAAAVSDVDASTLYVDPTNGNDANSGTSPAQALQHVAVAVQRARALPAPATVILRGGVHRLTETLALGPADNGLTITAYPGEQPVLSSGVVVTPSWQPYNISGGSWVNYPNTDAMWGDWPDPAIVNSSTAASPAACEARCQGSASPQCNAWIWYDPAAYSSPWGGFCFLRTDTAFSPAPQNSTYSGRRTPGKNIYSSTVANIPAWVTSRDDFVLSLLYSPDGGVNVRRATRARYPDADPELTQYPSGWTNAGTYQHGVLDMNTSVVNVPLPDNYQGMFGDYWWGVGGPCSRYTPPSSYWCQPNGRVAGATYFVNTPAGLVTDNSALPNGPYTSNVTGNGAILNYWRHGHWFTMMARVSGYTASNSTLTLGYGAFQGAEGDATGEAWYIEHVFEELDAPNEFFYDSQAQTLYYFHNDTAGTPPPASWTWELPLLQVLVSITGDPSTPAQDITLDSLTFTSAAPTYLAPHGTPSGGDWGLARVGAVFLEGTEGVTVSNSLFTRVDGNGVFISGYNRNTSVVGNEFVWIGDSAVASWGFTDGLDGTAGAQPWYNNVSYNWCHEIGFFEKQSSCYFQATTALSHIEGNVFFNGPRAMVNFNDGMPPGGSTLYRNLIFNTCRESSDHGPFNSWDRVPYLNLLPNGTATLFQIPNELSYNFMVANYGADGGTFDNDDGSSRYLDHHNFAIYGGHKNDFDGHQKLSYSNLYAFANCYGSRCMAANNPTVGWDEGLFNNTCILGNGYAPYTYDYSRHGMPVPATAAGKVDTEAVVPPGWTPASSTAGAAWSYFSVDPCDPKGNNPGFGVIMHDNSLYVPGGAANLSVSCGGTLSFAQWQATGLDPGTAVLGDVPAPDTIVTWGAQLLGIPWP